MMFPFGDFQLFTCAFGSDSRSLMLRSANSSECSVMDNGDRIRGKVTGSLPGTELKSFTHARSGEEKEEGTKPTPLLILCGL